MILITKKMLLYKRVTTILFEHEANKNQIIKIYVNEYKTPPYRLSLGNKMIYKTDELRAKYYSFL